MSCKVSVRSQVPRRSVSWRLHPRRLRAVAGWAVAVCSLGAQAVRTDQLNPRFSGIQQLTNKEIALTLSVSNGVAHRIEISSNLTDWSALVTLPGTNVTLQHTDSAAPYVGQRFYRAAQLSGTNFLTG